MHRISICACARWEEHHIVEWIEYHLSIGVDHFFIYDNNDEYSTMVEVLLPYITRPNPIVTYTHCPESGEQVKMYEHYRINYSQKSEWTLIIDLDEFIALPGYGMNINNLIESKQGLNFYSIQFNWLNFGPNGYVTRPPGGVLTKYTRCSEKLNKHTKYMVRREILEQRNMPPFLHCLPLDVPTIDVLGNFTNSILWQHMGLESQYMEYLNSVNNELMQAGFICHYHCKSHEDAERRVARCTAGWWSNQIAYQDMVDNPAKKYEFFNHWETCENLLMKEYWENYTIKTLLPNNNKFTKIEAHAYVQSGKWYEGF